VKNSLFFPNKGKALKLENTLENTENFLEKFRQISQKSIVFLNKKEYT